MTLQCASTQSHTRIHHTVLVSRQSHQRICHCALVVCSISEASCSALALSIDSLNWTSAEALAGARARSLPKRRLGNLRLQSLGHQWPCWPCHCLPLVFWHWHCPIPLESPPPSALPSLALDSVAGPLSFPAATKTLGPAAQWHDMWPVPGAILPGHSPGGQWHWQ